MLFIYLIEKDEPVLRELNKFSTLVNAKMAKVTFFRGMKPQWNGRS